MRRVIQPISIAGPCVIKSEELLDTVTQRLVDINRKLDTDIVFKASFGKANRTSTHLFRSPGLEKGLQIFTHIKETYKLRITTDIRESWQAEAMNETYNILQIPAFLCRQTDLSMAAAATGETVNIRKTQFLGGKGMRHPVEKVMKSGAKEIWLTERGNCFGYNNLVIDFENISDTKEIVKMVIMDCIHCVQGPGAGKGRAVGDRRFMPAMAHAAKAFGAIGYFFETHPTSDEGLSDVANILELDKLEPLIASLLQ